jgi:hypothetical protein
MFHRPKSRFLVAWALSLASLLPPVWSQPARDKAAWNYDGGLVMQTEGSLPNGICFRLNGKLNADDFFDNLKRFDSESGTVYRRGNEVVTEFPSTLHLSFAMYDSACLDRLQETGKRLYLNQSIMRTLRLSFFWKRGMELRPVRGIVPKNFEARLIPWFSDEHTQQLPERYEWWFEYDVSGENVPLTDSLVVILRSEDHRIAARVAARM